MSTEIKPEDSTPKQPAAPAPVASDTSKKLEKEVAIDEEALDTVVGGRHVAM